MKSFQLFGLHVSFLGLMAAVGFLIGFYFAKKEAKRKNLSIDVLYSLAVYTLVSAIVGARIFYIVFYNFNYYQMHPWAILKIYDGGLSIHGALLAAFLAAFIYIRKHRLNFLKYADAVAPSIILGQAIGRVGCDVFGKPMVNSQFWGVMYQGQIVHPVQMYEALLNYIAFFFLWRMRKHTAYHGQLFFTYIILFAINRGIVEFFRFNPSIVGWFSISHLLSVVFILIAVSGMVFTKRNTAIKTKPSAQSDTDDAYGLELMKDILFVLIIVILSFIVFYTVQT